MTERQWKELRVQFFKECVDVCLPGDEIKVNLSPHNMFEWFKAKINSTDVGGSLPTDCDHISESTGFKCIGGRCQKCGEIV